MDVPTESEHRVLETLLERGFNLDREAVTVIAARDDPDEAIERLVETIPSDVFKISGQMAKEALSHDSTNDLTSENSPVTAGNDPFTSTAQPEHKPKEDTNITPVETKGSTSTSTSSQRHPGPIEIVGDITGESTGTGEFEHFVAVFRDRYERLSRLLKHRVTHRPLASVRGMAGGQHVELIGMVNDIRSTVNGHRMIELEDPTGTFRCLVIKDREIVRLVDELLHDEVIGVTGTLSDDSGIVFIDEIFFPDVPRTNQPSTADRFVQAALISDIHVGSDEFAHEAWDQFTDWLTTPEASAVEYLLIAGDMVEGVGVYPNQDEELSIVDIYDQYEQFAEHLKDVPGDIKQLIIPGNHDAVRLAEPQPAIDEELQSMFDAHNAEFSGNPSTVTIEGVTVLMYHGMSLDEIIAEVPSDRASYDAPQLAMECLLRKRHLAPKYGGKMRIAPEERDYLVIDSIPDVFHTGHVHKVGFGTYNGIKTVNSGCWQKQTAFQRSVNIDPDVGHAPIIDLDTLDITVHKFI